MGKKFKYIIILAFSIFLVGCAFGKNSNNIEAPKEQLNADNLEEKPLEEAKKESNAEDDKKDNAKSEVKGKEEVEANKPNSGNKKKIIYLTFDDGPSYKVTNNVLDILKENKVKATFFLIGNQIKGREEVVKRIYNEGNAIGLHSYTHNYKKIYVDEDNFIREMLECRKEVKRVVGISANIIRFPGGSYKHLNKDFLKKLHDNKFKVYDWNLENGDGLKPQTSPDELYEKAIKGSEGKNKIYLLLHCNDTHENTSKALTRIIKYYKAKNYEFKVITEETKEIYAPIKDETTK